MSELIRVWGAEAQCYAMVTMPDENVNSSQAIQRSADASARPKPYDFMRARRPELFSDSTTIYEPQITRELFDYHLESLTNRKQELQFEHFCRKLAEQEICPNLLPQTGPTGGGDSKVDAETYPVADAISERWYEGLAREATASRSARLIPYRRSFMGKGEVASDDLRLYSGSCY